MVRAKPGPRDEALAERPQTDRGRSDEGAAAECARRGTRARAARGEACPERERGRSGRAPGRSPGHDRQVALRRATEPRVAARRCPAGGPRGYSGQDWRGAHECERKTTEPAGQRGRGRWGRRPGGVPGREPLSEAKGDERRRRGVWSSCIERMAPRVRGAKRKGWGWRGSAGPARGSVARRAAAFFVGFFCSFVRPLSSPLFSAPLRRRLSPPHLLFVWFSGLIVRRPTSFFSTVFLHFLTDLSPVPLCWFSMCSGARISSSFCWFFEMGASLVWLGGCFVGFRGCNGDCPFASFVRPAGPDGWLP